MNTNYSRKLTHALISLKTEKEMGDFINGILSPQELLEISKRLEIVKMLKKGVSQVEISKKLGVGIATVTRGSKELQKGRFKYV